MDIHSLPSALQRTSSAPPENFLAQENISKKKLMMKYLNKQEKVESFHPSTLNSQAEGDKNVPKSLPQNTIPNHNNVASISENNHPVPSQPLTTEPKPSLASRMKKKNMKLTSGEFKPEEVQKEEQLLGDWAPSKIFPGQPKKPTKPETIFTPKAEPTKIEKFQKPKTPQKEEFKAKKVAEKEPPKHVTKEASLEKDLRQEEELRLQKEKEEQMKKKQKEEEEAIALEKAKEEAAKAENELKKKKQEEEMINPARIKRRILIEMINSLKNSSLSDSGFSEDLLKIKNRRQMMLKFTKPKKDNERPNQNYNNRQNDRNSQKKRPQHGKESKPGKDDDMNRRPADPFREKLKAEGNKWIQANKEKTETDTDLKLFKEVRFCLNRLTPENFESLKKEILSFAKIGPSACEKVVLLIIEKSYQERRYSKVYAELCKFLKRDPSINYVEKGDGDEEESRKKKNFFTNHLLNLLQETFYQHMSEERNTDVSQLDEAQKEEFFRVKKNRILGNVHFIGDLLTIKVISKKVIWICAYQMMVRFYTEIYDWVYFKKESCQRYEENLEGILTLVEKIGSIVDQTEAKNEYTPDVELDAAQTYSSFLDMLLHQNLERSQLPSEENDNPIINLNVIFNWMNLIKDHSLVSTRMRCLLVNIIEIRKNNWQKTILQPTGPRTMQELRNEYDDQKHSAYDRDEEEDNRQSGRKGKGKPKGKVEYVQKEAEPETKTKKNVLDEEVTAKRLANIYQRIQEGKMDDGTTVNDELIIQNMLELHAETTSYTFVMAALSSIYERKPIVYNYFIELLIKLILDKKISAKETATAINSYLEKACYNFSENPNLCKYLAELSSSMLNASLISISDLNYESRDSIEKNDPDQMEEFEYFLSEYFHELLSKVKIADLVSAVKKQAQENCPSVEF